MFMQALTTPASTEIVNQLVDVIDSKFFKTLSEPVRIQILRLILVNGRTDIGTIAEQLPQDRSVISRHLNLMQEVGILTCEKQSRHMFYEINAQAFLDKLVNITELVRTCMAECCPDCCGIGK